MDWTKLADEGTLEKTVAALRERGINAMIVKTAEEARRKVLELIPQGAEVYSGQSATLNEAGITKELDESGGYDSVRKRITAESDEQKRRETRRKSLVPEYAVGSVQAVTENGQVVVASNSGSQLALYSAGAAHLIWVVGAQKIVKNLDDAFKRIEEYALPLESERLKKLYGIPSNIGKLLIINKEMMPNRITLIFVRERLGF